MTQRDVTLILGQTGSGKTYHAAQFIKKHPRVLVADCGFEEFGVPMAETYDDLLDRMEGRRAFGTHRPYHLGYEFRPNQYAYAFETALNAKDTLLVLEEADRFSEVVRDEENHVVYAGANDNFYKEAVYRGRHYGLSLLLISLSPRAIPTEVRRQATRIISFSQVFPDDLDWLAEVVGEEAYTLAELPGPPQRPPHPYLLWTKKDGSKIIRP